MQTQAFPGHDMRWLWRQHASRTHASRNPTRLHVLCTGSAGETATAYNAVRVLFALCWADRDSRRTRGPCGPTVSYCPRPPPLSKPQQRCTACTVAIGSPHMGAGPMMSGFELTSTIFTSCQTSSVQCPQIVLPCCHCSANQTSAECCLEFTARVRLSNVLWAVCVSWGEGFTQGLRGNTASDFHNVFTDHSGCACLGSPWHSREGHPWLA